jgi:integrase
MPRRGENIYKRKDGRWEGRVLNYDGKYKYVYAKTYKEVKEKKKLLQEAMTKNSPQKSPMNKNAAALFHAWLNGDLICRVKPSTYESYYRCITKYVIPFYEEKGHEHITVKTTSDFSRRINNNQSLSASYRRKILTIYKTALRQLLKGSYECEAILGAVSMPKVSPGEVQVFSVREQRLIEKTAMEFPDQLSFGFLLCFYTGLRLGEICALKWEDIDMEEGSLVVTRTVSRVKNFRTTGEKTMLCVGAPKSLKSIRKIPLPRFLMDFAKRVNIDSSHKDCFVLTNREVPMDPRRYQKLFQTLLTNANVKRRKFHAIRHTFATRALELGVDIKTLSEILGHANVSITLNIYAHSLYEQKKKAIDKLNAMYVMHAEGDTFAVTSAVRNP